VALPSIHYRRRWFYVLWGGLLAASLGALARWETPKSRTEASLKVILRCPQDAPEGTRVQAWAGPAAQRPAASWQGEGAFADLPLDASHQVALPTVRMHVASRRWVRNAFVPRGTWNLLVLKVSRPGLPPRFLVASLDDDLAHGALVAGHLLIYSLTTRIGSLALDPKAP